MRILFDTNVIVSAVLRDRVPEEIILFVVERPDFEWVVSPEIMREYKDVLSRDKFNLPADILQQWFEILDAFTTTIDVDLDVEFERDPNDAKFLACAIAAEADFFVTGDLDFSEARELVDTKIVSVSLFKKYVSDVLSQ